MKKFLSVALGLSLGAALLAPNFASAEDKKDEKKPATKKEGAKKKVTCPVTGEEVKDVTKAEKAEYKGKTYYFCCKDCKPKFDKDPAKFTKAKKKQGKKKEKKEEKKEDKK